MRSRRLRIAGGGVDEQGERMAPIRVLIVDDHPMVRRGLQSLLSSYDDIDIVAEAGDAAGALRQVARQPVDVVLLDIKMSGPDGVSVAARLHREFPDVRVIVLTAFDEDEYVRGALRAGVFAYLLKGGSEETVVDAIRQVYQGKRLVSADLVDGVLRQFQEVVQAHDETRFGLSPEDLRILELIAEGATNDEIASEVCWGQRTVKRKVEEIMTKLGARNRAQAAAMAVKKSLI